MYISVIFTFCVLCFLIKKNNDINGIKEYIERGQMVLISLEEFGEFCLFLSLCLCFSSSIYHDPRYRKPP